MISLKNTKGNEITSGETTLNVKGVNFVIEVPEQPLKVGQEYTFTARTDYPEKLTEAPSYEWDFGDGPGLIIPFSNEVAHVFQKPGNYVIHVEIFESTEKAANVLGSALVTVEVGEATEAKDVDLLSYIQKTTYLLINVCGEATYHQSDGLTRPPEGLSLQVYSGQPSTKWTGTHFNNEYYTPPTDSSSGITITLEGDVSADGNLMLNVSGIGMYDDSLRKSGEKRETKISLMNVKLVSKSPLPIPYDPDYNNVCLVGYIEGPEVTNFVTNAYYEYIKPSTSDPDFKMWYESMVFSNTKYTPYLLVVFKTSRIDAYDDPGYQKR
jgi:hypothetical protein